jgi:hypothetical protein
VKAVKDGIIARRGKNVRNIATLAAARKMLERSGAVDTLSERCSGRCRRFLGTLCSPAPSAV